MAAKQKGLFDVEFRQQKISKFNDPLQTLNDKIEWEAFREEIEANFLKGDPKKGGRPSYDKVLMFKILILQHFYDLSEEQAEFQIADRFSFMKFLGLELHDPIPDSNTIRLFREQLTQAGSIDRLFELFNARLSKAGLIGKEGRIVDASFVTAPRQRNTRQENEQIKEGKTPDGWSNKKKAHKDIDATWTKKNNETYFGYKNHILMDADSKLITNFETTPASEHDGNVLTELIEGMEKGMALYGDSAYRSAEKEEMLSQRGIISKIHEKGKRNEPLTEEQKQSNRQKSKVRARVEHVFGWMHRNCQQTIVRTIGLARANAKITLRNIVYNMGRAAYLTREQAIKI